MKLILIHKINKVKSVIKHLQKNNSFIIENECDFTFFSDFFWFLILYKTNFNVFNLKIKEKKKCLVKFIDFKLVILINFNSKYLALKKF